jgi:hypothetical protein
MGIDLSFAVGLLCDLQLWVWLCVCFSDLVEGSVVDSGGCGGGWIVVGDKRCITVDHNGAMVF